MENGASEAAPRVDAIEKQERCGSVRAKARSARLAMQTRKLHYVHKILEELLGTQTNVRFEFPPPKRKERKESDELLRLTVSDPAQHLHNKQASNCVLLLSSPLLQSRPRL